MRTALPEIFSKNRNEESPEDNWLDFVIPPFLDSLGIKTQSKAIVIEGGRGCGKTTLLRYFCHAAQFSSKRHDLPTDVLDHIGIYWRADTNFLNSFSGGDQSASTWQAAFDHTLACEFGREIIRSIRSINCTPSRIAKYGKLDELDLSALNDFDPKLGNNLYDIERNLTRSRNQLEVWLNNLDSTPHPRFIPSKAFLKCLINELKEQLPYLRNSTFAVFIDEYENLRIEQQKFINGYLKHGTPPLIYNIALKRNGWQTKETLGPESIQEISDYRVIQLESETQKDFELFAAELLFFRLSEKRPELLERLPIDPEKLRSIESIKDRYENDIYRESVLKAAEEMLPRVGEREAAKIILSNKKLRGILENNISEALKERGSKLNFKDFISDEKPEASVIMPALLNRARETPENIHKEFKNLIESNTGRLHQSSPLINNNLFGCVNSIYIDSGINSILFSGFTVLTLIARGNIRHLLELIHRIFKAHEHEKDNELPIVPAEAQAKAVRDASESIISTVSGFGTYGPQLYSLALCLGSIFRERHRNTRQSEPEINHFTLSSGDINDKIIKYLDEAEKWSVLFIEKETKMKSTGSISSDYILNPIFSPYFQISFRKKRSIQLSTTQVLSILEGEQSDRDKLVREIGRNEKHSLYHADLFGDA